MPSIDRTLSRRAVSTFVSQIQLAINVLLDSLNITSVATVPLQQSAHVGDHALHLPLMLRSVWCETLDSSAMVARKALVYGMDDRLVLVGFQREHFWIVGCCALRYPTNRFVYLFQCCQRVLLIAYGHYPRRGKPGVSKNTNEYPYLHLFAV